jgi:hypothetical protein
MGRRPWNSLRQRRNRFNASCCVYAGRAGLGSHVSRIFYVRLSAVFPGLHRYICICGMYTGGACWELILNTLGKEVIEGG